MICGFWGFVLRLMVYWPRCFIFGFMISWLRGFIWFWLFISWLRDCFIGNFRMFVVSIEYREYMRGMVGRVGRCRWGISWFRGLIFRLFICWLRFFVSRLRVLVVSIEYREYMRGMVGRVPM